MLCADGKKVTGKDGKGGDVEMFNQEYGVSLGQKKLEMDHQLQSLRVVDFSFNISPVSHFISIRLFFVCERASIPPYISLLREPTVDHNRMIPDDSFLSYLHFLPYYQLNSALYR